MFPSFSPPLSHLHPHHTCTCTFVLHAMWLAVHHHSTIGAGAGTVVASNGLPVDVALYEPFSASSVVSALTLIAGSFALTGPYLGTWSDTHKSRRAVVLIGAVFSTGGAFTMYVGRKMSSILVIAVGYLCMFFGVITNTTITSTLVSDFGTLHNKVGVFSSILALANSLGNAMAYMGGAYLFPITTDSSSCKTQAVSDTANYYLFIAFVNGVTGVISFLFSRNLPKKARDAPGAPADLSSEALAANSSLDYQTFDEHGLPIPASATPKSGGICGSIASWYAESRAIIRTVWNKEEYEGYRLVWIARVAYFFAIAPLFSFLLYYFEDLTDAGRDAQHALTISGGIALGAGMVSSLVAAPIVDRFGRKMLVYVSVFFMSMLLFVLPQMSSTNLIYCVIWIMGVSVNMYYIADLALCSDVLPEVQNKARDMGIWNIGGFLGTAFGSILGPILGLFVTDEPSADCSKRNRYSRNGYMVVFSLSASALLISLYAFYRIKVPEKPAEDKHNMSTYSNMH
jgi:MFS family permease